MRKVRNAVGYGLFLLVVILAGSEIFLTYLEPAPQWYFSATVMPKGMAALNAVLLDVCKARDLFCIDLASRVSKSDANFFDDMHFNENGIDSVAAIVAYEIAANASRSIAARKL